MTDKNIYVGTKTVTATPMKRGEYNKLRGWEIPQDENPETEGYLIEYKKGGKPNHPNFAGYISWSPKEVFETTYRVIGKEQETNQLVLKLIQEFNEVNDRTEPLRVFLSKPQPTFISDQEWLILHDQLDAMADYRDCLMTRIALHTIGLKENEPLETHIGVLGEE